MRLHADVLGEGCVPAGALVEVTALRGDDAEVALRQALETGITVALAETFFRGPTALDTINSTSEGQ